VKTTNIFACDLIFCDTCKYICLCFYTNLIFCGNHKYICLWLYAGLIFCDNSHHLPTSCAILYLSTVCVQSYKNNRLFCDLLSEFRMGCVRSHLRFAQYKSQTIGTPKTAGFSTYFVTLILSICKFYLLYHWDLQASYVAQCHSSMIDIQ